MSDNSIEDTSLMGKHPSVPIAAQSGERPIGVSVKILAGVLARIGSEASRKIAFQKLDGPNSKKAGRFEARRI